MSNVTEAPQSAELSALGMGQLAVRLATPEDVAAIQAIYAIHVLTGTGTFEETPPDLNTMARRYDAIVQGGFPYLVASDQGRVRGFAYASVFRPRSGYRYTVEDSIYVHPDAAGRGLGRRLLADLIIRCQAQGFRQMVAMIGDSANHASIAVHARLGFERAGVLPSVGLKFGRWIDVLFMARALGPGATSHPPVAPPEA